MKNDKQWKCLGKIGSIVDYELIQKFPLLCVEIVCIAPGAALVSDLLYH